MILLLAIINTTIIIATIEFTGFTQIKSTNYDRSKVTVHFVISFFNNGVVYCFGYSVKRRLEVKIGYKRAPFCGSGG